MEGPVLLRVKRFQQRGRRVALEVARKFVDLVQDDDRVGGAGPLDAGEDPARQGADIGLAVAADLRLIVHAAEGNPDVFAPEGPGDGLAEARLADPGRAVQAEDRGLHVALQLEDGQVFDDAVLDRVQPEMVLVQDLLRVLQVQVVLRLLAPGQVEHELDVVVLDAVVGGTGVVLLQARHLLLEDGLHRLGPLLRGGPLAELREFLALVHAQFLLDGAELVVEVVFALLLVDVAADLLVDLLLDAEQLDLGLQDREQLHAAHLHVAVLEEVHLVGEMLHLDRGRDEIDQEGIVLDGLEGGHGLLRGEGGGTDDLRRLLLEGVHEDQQLVVVHVGDRVLQVMHARHDIRVILQDISEFEPPDALQDGRHRAVRHLDGLDDLGDGPVAGEVLLQGLLHGNVGLGDGPEESVPRLDFADQADGFFPADGHRVHRPREEDGIAERKHGDDLRQLIRVEMDQGVTLDNRHDVHFHAAGRKAVFIVFHKVPVIRAPRGMTICHILSAQQSGRI